MNNANRLLIRSFLLSLCLLFNSICGTSVFDNKMMRSFFNLHVVPAALNWVSIGLQFRVLSCPSYKCSIVPLSFYTLASTTFDFATNRNSEKSLNERIIYHAFLFVAMMSRNQLITNCSEFFRDGVQVDYKSELTCVLAWLLTHAKVDALCQNMAKKLIMRLERTQKSYFNGSIKK